MTEKDINNLVLTKSDKLLSFQANLVRMVDLMEISDPRMRLTEAVALGRDLDARYLVLMENVSWYPRGTHVVAATSSFSVLDLCPDSERCRRN
jgi:hypothetical protein